MKWGAENLFGTWEMLEQRVWFSLIWSFSLLFMILSTCFHLFYYLTVVPSHCNKKLSLTWCRERWIIYVYSRKKIINYNRHSYNKWTENEVDQEDNNTRYCSRIKLLVGSKCSLSTPSSLSQFLLSLNISLMLITLHLLYPFYKQNEWLIQCMNVWVDY